MKERHAELMSEYDDGAKLEAVTERTGLLSPLEPERSHGIELVVKEGARGSGSTTVSPRHGI